MRGGCWEIQVRNLPKDARLPPRRGWQTLKHGKREIAGSLKKNMSAPITIENERKTESMTFLEFQRKVAGIEQEQYQGGEVSPFLFGLRRAEFEAAKFERLIRLAEGCDSKTAMQKSALWKRQLVRAQRNCDSFRRLLAENSPASRNGWPPAAEPGPATLFPGRRGATAKLRTDGEAG